MQYHSTLPTSPTSQHTRTFNTRIPVPGREGWDSPVRRRRRREGDRERWGKEEAGGKEGGREGGKEGRREEGGKEGRREGGNEGGNEGGRELGR